MKVYRRRTKFASLKVDKETHDLWKQLLRLYAKALNKIAEDVLKEVIDCMKRLTQHTALGTIEIQQCTQATIPLAVRVTNDVYREWEKVKVDVKLSGYNLCTAFKTCLKYVFNRYRESFERSRKPVVY